MAASRKALAISVALAFGAVAGWLWLDGPVTTGAAGESPGVAAQRISGARKDPASGEALQQPAPQQATPQQVTAPPWPGANPFEIAAPVPAEAIPRRIQELEAEINSGIVRNAYDLYELLERCSRPAAGYAHLVVAASGGARLASAPIGEAKGDAPPQPCAAVPPDSIQRRFAILELAAANGDVRAQAALATASGRDDRGANLRDRGR